MQRVGYICLEASVSLCLLSVEDWSTFIVHEDYEAICLINLLCCAIPCTLACCALWSFILEEGGGGGLVLVTLARRTSPKDIVANSIFYRLGCRDGHAFRPVVLYCRQVMILCSTPSLQDDHRPSLTHTVPFQSPPGLLGWAPSPNGTSCQGPCSRPPRRRLCRAPGPAARPTPRRCKC